MIPPSFDSQLQDSAPAAATIQLMGGRNAHDALFNNSNTPVVATSALAA